MLRNDRREAPESKFHDYDFSPYLEALGTNWYTEDELLKKILRRFAPDAARESETTLLEFGARAAGVYRELADVIEQPEKLPYISHKDAYNRRHDHVVIPPETERMLREVHGARLSGGELNDFVRYAIQFMLSQNGESGFGCSLACTDGLIRALRELGDDERSKQTLGRLLNNSVENWVHGAQFVTEIQGGSDAATNAVQAKPVGEGLFLLSGEKWFCSNCTADYWLTTARPGGAPEGGKGVAMFVVPRLREDGTPNGYAIERLKDKLGTRALPTAEITFDGAEAWMLGPPDAGLKNMVAIVLVTSRVLTASGTAGMLRGASRIVTAYCRFREAFGVRIDQLPLVSDTLGRIQRESDLALAGVFETFGLWFAHAPNGRALGDLASRVHVSLAKAVSTRLTQQLLYEAMVLIGGNGIEERFSALPRLVRDSAIYETWEGPYTLLLMQALDDLVRFEVRGREEEFFEQVWPTQDVPIELVSVLRELLADPQSEKNVLGFRRFAHDYYSAYQKAALSHYQ
jgi:alkylation response protein AidB-like acyl-CoA dehydrogenase